jgi:hypothetical protein
VDTLVGFHVDGWDYLTFAALFIVVAAAIALAILILGLPGRIAIARKHPEAEAVYLMGYIGFLAVVPWVKALIWAFKPTDVIDIRYWPAEERRETDAMLAQLTGRTGPGPTGKTGPGEEPSQPGQSRTP